MTSALDKETAEDLFIIFGIGRTKMLEPGAKVGRVGKVEILETWRKSNSCGVLRISVASMCM